MLPVKRRCGNSMKDMEIHGESNVWGCSSKIENELRTLCFIYIYIYPGEIYTVHLINTQHVDLQSH